MKHLNSELHNRNKNFHIYKRIIILIIHKSSLKDFIIYFLTILLPNTLSANIRMTLSQVLMKCKYFNILKQISN